MLFTSLEFVIGLALLIWGADRFAGGAVSIARYFGVSPLLIGLTIVAFATSAPEILVSVVASLHGEPDLAIGNAIGSNIVNIGLVLGLVALIRPIQMNSATVRREMPMLLAVSLLTVSLFLDAYISRVDGFVLLVSLAIIMVWLTRIGLKSSADDPIVAEVAAEIPQYTNGRASTVQLAIGLVALLIGAELLVDGAVAIAINLGVSEIVIGLVLVAFGTSLPELAVSLAGALKGEYGLALGNIVGSNIFNSLAVIGIAGAIQPAALPPTVLSLHLFVMVAFTLVLYAATFDLDGKQQISRLEGFSMLVAFVAYEVYTLAPSFID
jgi:cation:H+ antiporter